MTLLLLLVILLLLFGGGGYYTGRPTWRGPVVSEVLWALCAVVLIVLLLRLAGFWV